MSRKPGTRVCPVCDDCIVAPSCAKWCQDARDYILEHVTNMSVVYGQNLREKDGTEEEQL